MEKITEKIKKTIREILSPELFPVGEDKNPAIPKGTTWKFDTDEPEKRVIRITENYRGLVGVNLRGILAIVYDIDPYNPDFKASPEAQEAAERIKKATSFIYRTKNGGWHCWFRQGHGEPVRCGKPWPGIDRKADGGYVVCWNFEDFRALGDFETMAEFYKALPEVPKGLEQKYNESLLNSKKREFGPGKNNHAIPQRAGKAAFSKDQAKTAANDVDDLYQKNANRPDFERKKHLEDYIKKLFESAGYRQEQEKAKNPEGYEHSDNDAQDLINRMSSLGYTMRKNILSFKTEIQSRGSTTWAELDDDLENKIFTEIRDIGKAKLRKGEFAIRKSAALHGLRVNPFLLFLKGLPEWDGSNRLDTLFETLFDILDKDQLPLARAAGFNLFGGIIRRNLFPGCQHDEVLTLFAEQGTGKSSFLRAIVPDPNMFSSSISFTDSYQKFTESLEGCVLIELAELAKAKKADIGKIKNWVSMLYDNVRKSYRRNKGNYPRQCLFVATVDRRVALPDDQNRRFVLFELGQKFPVGAMLKKLKAELPMLWTEALHRIKAGESPRLKPSLWAASAKAAEKHRGFDEVFEEAFLEIILPKEDSPTIEYKGEKYHCFSMAKALEKLSDRYETQEVAEGKSIQVFVKGIIPRPDLRFQHLGGGIASRKDVGFERKNIRIDGTQRKLWIRKAEG